MILKFGRLYKTEKEFKGVLGGVPVTTQKKEQNILIFLDTQQIKESFKKQFLSYPLFSFFSAADAYKGKIRIDILDIKINGNLKKIPYLAEKLITIYKENPILSKIDVIIPCPHSADNKIALTDLLSIEMGKKIEKPVLLNIIKRTKNFEFSQVELSPKERIQNVKGAFKTDQTREIKEKICLLIDDIITTGATANECANLLLSAGAKKVYLITLAQSVKRIYSNL